MKKDYWIATITMLLSLLIYLFYRTEKTVINQLFISLFSYERFAYLRFNNFFTPRLNEHVIYSLPEGLWILCITLTSKPFFVKMGRHKFYLVFLPLVFSVGLEIFQLLQIRNGRFDWWDIGFSIFFWALACFGMKLNTSRKDIFNPFTFGSFICILSYSIVYLAHVWK